VKFDLPPEIDNQKIFEGLFDDYMPYALMCAHYCLYLYSLEEIELWHMDDMNPVVQSFFRKRIRQDIAL